MAQETFPTSQNAFIPPGRQKIITAPESAWGIPGVTGSGNSVGTLEWVDSFTPTIARTPTPITPKVGVPSGIVDSVETDHRGTPSLSFPWRSHGVGVQMLANLIGSTESGATDTVTGSGPYVHPFVLGTSSTRCGTQSAWVNMGGRRTNETLLFPAMTPVSMAFAWDHALLGVTANYESLFPITGDDFGYVAVPSGGNLKSIGGSGGPSKMVTRGLEVQYNIYNSAGDKYSIPFTGGTITLSRTVKQVWGKLNGFLTPLAAMAGPTISTAGLPIDTGNLRASTSYSYYTAAYNSATGAMGYLSPVTAGSTAAPTVAGSQQLKVTYLTPPSGSTDVLVYRQDVSGIPRYIGSVHNGVGSWTAPLFLIDTGFGLGQAYNGSTGLVDPINPFDLQNGTLQLAVTLNGLFDGVQRATMYGDYLDFAATGTSGSKHQLLWIDRNGHALQFDMYPLRVDPATINDTGESMDLSISFTGEYDPAGVVAGTMDLVKPTVTNDVSGTYITT